MSSALFQGRSIVLSPLTRRRNDDAHIPMDLDLERPLTMPSRLEFADNLGALGLGGLDISFDAEAAADGKIRVRIHHPGSSTPSSPVLPASPFEIDAPTWGSGWNTPSSEDPFLGVGAPLDLEEGMFGFDLPRSRSVSPSIDTPHGRRRVRIALKSAPAGTAVRPRSRPAS